MATRTLQDIQNDFQTLQQRILSEGITDSQGNVLQAPQQQPQPETYKDAFDAIKEWFEEMKRQGKTINPNIEITPEKAAEFLTLAKSQVAPYYSSQLGAARQSLLSGLGFSSEEVLAKENELEKKYGLDVRKLGEQAAEKGFTFSGRRQEEERQLAGDTQAQIESGRRQLGYTSETLASTFAQKYGGTNIPTSTIGQTPRALPGETSFSRDGSNQPLYSLSPGIYDQLVGSEQKAEATGARDLSQFYEGQYRTELKNKQNREITLGY